MAEYNIGQLLLVGVPGPELNAETAAFFRKVQPGGFILFGRNIKSPRQLRKLIDDLRDLSQIEPIITIDQEGGRVSRLRLLGNEPPNAQQLRAADDLSLIRRHGEITGSLLRLFGFNLDLCPVLDISFDDDADNSLKGRCYGKTVEEVIERAGVFNTALRSTGILSCGKHFPGYSSAGNDPHHELPVIDRSRALLDKYELAVFKHFSHSVDSMMIGHIAFPSLDPDLGDTIEEKSDHDGQNDLLLPSELRFAPLKPRPSSLSPVVVQKLLREEFGFGGLIMTDDLDMGAILNHYGFDDTMRLGLRAGNDLLMLCHRFELATQAVQAIERVERPTLDRAFAHMAAFKRKFAPPDPFSEERFRELDDAVWQLRVDTLGEERARERSPEDGKRSPVEIY